MIINHNLNAMNANRAMSINVNAGAKSMEKLSSGLRINRAGDDAAGLSISEKMRAQIRGLDQASRNAQDGISLIQTAEGALQESQEIVQRMRELAVQAANDTNVKEDRDAIKAEVDELVKEIDRIAQKTTFNEKTLLDGKLTKAVGVFQIGADKGTTLTVTIATMTAAKLSLNGFTFATHLNAASAISKFDKAIKTISTERSKLGANQNRLEHTIKNLDNGAENIQAAESRVRDVNMAKEMMDFTRTNILSQASQAMLAQANQQPQAVLQLLR
jgi:flagellin